MKIRKNIKMTSEINMSSSSDIAFLLIIFFMVTSAFIFKDGLHMVLPDKSKKPQVVEDQELATISVKQDNTILLNDKKIEKTGLEPRLKKMLMEDEELIILLKIEKDVIYQNVIDVIDTIKLVGARKLSLRMI